MTKTIKELLDELKDLERHTHRGMWWVRLDKVESLISQVEALVRKQTVDDIHKILFNNDSKGASLVERYAKANNIII